MAPHTLKEDSLPKVEMPERLVGPQAGKREYEILYANILTFLYLHVAGSYGLYLCFVSAKWASIFNCEFSLHNFLITSTYKTSSEMYEIFIVS